MTVYGADYNTDAVNAQASYAPGSPDFLCSNVWAPIIKLVITHIFDVTHPAQPADFSFAQTCG